MIQPLGSLYYVRILDTPETTPGGIYLPETARETVWDAQILAVGLGAVLDSGARYPMQCSPGDRCIFLARDWMPLEGKEGFIPDTRLVARIPGPDHAELLPCNDYVFTLPEKTGALIESEGGVLVAAYALYGQEARLKRRGDELFAELKALEQSEYYQSQPSAFYKDKVVHDWLDGMSANDRAALYEAAYKRGGKASQWEAYTRYLKPHPARSGVVVDLGPGRVNPRSGAREPAELFHLCGVAAGLAVGDRAWFDDGYFATQICDGQRNLLAVPARFIAAVEAVDDPADLGPGMNVGLRDALLEQVCA